MSCKDCIHFVACVDFWYSDYDCFDNIEQSKQKHANDEVCVHFKPTADVVEVRHGEWLPQFEGARLLQCSVCGYEYCDLIECGNYCGNCGAKMKGD